MQLPWSAQLMICVSWTAVQTSNDLPRSPTGRALTDAPPLVAAALSCSEPSAAPVFAALQQMAGITRHTDGARRCLLGRACQALRCHTSAGMESLQLIPCAFLTAIIQPDTHKRGKLQCLN